MSSSAIPPAVTWRFGLPRVGASPRARPAPSPPCGPPGRLPSRYDLASPIERLPLGVPQLLVHGDADDAVPVELSRRYAERARERGDPCEYAELPGYGHFEHIDPSSHAWRVVTEWLGHRSP